MRSIPTDDGAQESLTEAMAPADESASQITIDSDEQIPGKVLALPEVKDSISRAGAGGRSAKAAPEAPAALAEPDAARDSSAQSNEGAENFATRSGGSGGGAGGDGGGAGAAGGSAYAGATTSGGAADAISRCSAALAATQTDPLEPIAVREISYKGRPAWLVVYGVRERSGNAIEEIRAFVVELDACATLPAEALDSAVLSRSTFKP
jgi:hypothetical protein